VRLALIPRTSEFYDLFAHAGVNAFEAARLAERRFREFPSASVSQSDVKRAETSGDAITHDLIQLLNTQYITPFDREDIYSLASALDDVMDMMDEAVDLVLLYEVTSLPAETTQQVEVLQRCAELTAAAMPKLESMGSLDEYWIEINRLENTGDQVHRRIIAALFNGETDALTVMKVKVVVDSLEAAMDAFEHVANTVEQIAVKEG